MVERSIHRFERCVCANRMPDETGDDSGSRIGLGGRM